MVSCDFAQQLFRALEQGSPLEAEVMLLAQELGIPSDFTLKSWENDDFEALDLGGILLSNSTWTRFPQKTGWFKGSSSPNLWWIQRRDLGYEPSRQESHEDDRDLEEGMVSARCLIEFSKLKCGTSVQSRNV